MWQFSSDLHMYVRDIASFLLGEDGEKLFSEGVKSGKESIEHVTSIFLWLLMDLCKV